MVRAPADQMNRNDLVDEVNRLRAEVDRLREIEVTSSLGQSSKSISERRLQALWGFARMPGAQVRDDESQAKSLQGHWAKLGSEMSTRAALNAEFEFDLIFSIEEVEVDLDAILAALVKVGCGDAIIGRGKAGLLGLGFTRTGTDPETVIASAALKISDVLPNHLRLREVKPDLVSLKEVAARLGVSLAVLKEGQLPPPSLGGLYHLSDLAMVLNTRNGTIAPALSEAAPWFAAAPGAQKINVFILAARVADR